jgi:hypothetical protein
MLKRRRPQFHIPKPAKLRRTKHKQTQPSLVVANGRALRKAKKWRVVPGSTPEYSGITRG